MAEYARAGEFKFYKRIFSNPILVVAMAAVIFTGCQSRDIRLFSELSKNSKTNGDKPFVAVYSYDGGTKDTAAAADIINKRLSTVCDGISRGRSIKPKSAYVFGSAACKFNAFGCGIYSYSVMTLQQKLRSKRAR